jgi:hypothetical protein
MDKVAIIAEITATTKLDVKAVKLQPSYQN